MIQIQGLKKTYRSGDNLVLACDVAQLSVAKGEHVALVGKSGCGKSTLLNILAGMMLPDSGTVQVRGEEMTRMSEGQRDLFRAQHIGMVFQTFNLLQPFTALENVMLGSVFGHGAVSRQRAEHLLQRVGLADRLGHRPNELSVGQQQRVAICRALIHDPELILADEPLGNQDRATGQEVLDLLLQMAREGDRTVLMVTHDPQSAQQMQRVLDLADLQESTVQEQR